MTIYHDVQGSYVGQLVTLFQLDCTMFDDGTILYFTSTAETSASLVFNGITYTPVAIEADGFEYNGKGAFPTPTLRLSNVSHIASALAISFDGLIGAKLTRIRTLRQYLDDGSTPDPLQIFTPDIYTVEQKTKHDNMSIEWKLSAAIDQQGRDIPGFRLVRDYCARIFRVWDPVTSSFNYNQATCRYSGAKYKLDNTSTALGTEDACPKTITGCKTRFGANAPLQFKGCPGLAKLH